MAEVQSAYSLQALHFTIKGQAKEKINQTQSKPKRELYNTENYKATGAFGNRFSHGKTEENKLKSTKTRKTSIALQKKPNQKIKTKTTKI